MMWHLVGPETFGRYNVWIDPEQMGTSDLGEIIDHAADMVEGGTGTRPESWFGWEIRIVPSVFGPEHD